jgi:hypothetical protein
MRETCERCGDKEHVSFRRVRMENELENLMYYVSIFLCEKCAWELRDRVAEIVVGFMERGKRPHEPQPTPESVAKLDEQCPPKKGNANEPETAPL